MSVEEWKTILTKEIEKNRQPVTSGSGLPFPEQIASCISAVPSMRSQLVSEQQVELLSFEGLEIESTPMSGPQVNPLSIGGS